MENIERKATLSKVMVTSHFITEKFNAETLGEL